MSRTFPLNAGCCETCLQYIVRVVRRAQFLESQQPCCMCSTAALSCDVTTRALYWIRVPSYCRVFGCSYWIYILWYDAAIGYIYIILWYSTSTQLLDIYCENKRSYFCEINAEFGKYNSNLHRSYIWILWDPSQLLDIYRGNKFSPRILTVRLFFDTVVIRAL